MREHVRPASVAGISGRSLVVLRNPLPPACRKSPSKNWSSIWVTVGGTSVQPSLAAISAQPSLAAISAQPSLAATSSPTDALLTAPGPIPVSGDLVASLQVYDDAMETFMTARDIQSGALAVMRNGRILLAHGFGWLDRAHRTVTPPDAMFRLASISKPMTAAAIRHLIETGAIKSETRVFPYLGIHPSRGAAEDGRLKTITVEELLDHQGGWDVGKLGYDPMFASIRVARSLGVRSPPSPRQVATYVAGLRLQFDPGTKTSYSNVGYMLLGLIIEKASGMPYLRYLDRAVLAPIAVAGIDRAQSLPTERDPREPTYQDPHTCPDVFAPPPFDRTVSCADGGFAIEAMEAHGGLIGTAPAVLDFMSHYWLTGDARSGNGQDWTFFGSLPGSFTLARLRPDGVTLVALFDQRGPNAEGYEKIKSILDKATDKVTAWP